MAKLCLKKPSKRILASRRYNIEKRVRQHNRKKRREARKKEGKAPKKLIQIPNICPFKEDILKTVEEYKAHKEEERQKAREAAKAEREAKKATDLEQLALLAREKELLLEDIDDSSEPNNEAQAEKIIKGGKLKSFYREFQKVIAAADVILEVVDARDPAGTRCPQVEELVRDSGENKRLVLILNKADLVPRDNLDRWIKYFRSSVPAIPFKSSTQNQGKRLGRRKLKKGEDVGSGGVCIGAEALTSLLGNYTRNKGIKTAIRVGVVGLPNVGKSSLINSLKRSRACKVGAVPGVTRSLQEVQLDSKIKLLDSPGLAFASADDPHAQLKNAVQTSDAIGAAEMILARANGKQLAKLYLIPEYKTSQQCLVSLAKRFGKYGKGGVPDLQAAGQMLLQDWNRGKISYHTEPPEVSNGVISTTLTLNSHVAEFDLAGYDKNAKINEDKMETDSIAATESSAGEYVVTAMNGKGKKKKRKSKGKGNSEEERKDGETLMEHEGSLKMKKLNKLNQKKLRKIKKKTEQGADSLSKAKRDEGEAMIEEEGSRKTKKLRKLNEKRLKKIGKKTARQTDALADTLTDISL